jgi:hypothetical protein
LRQRIEEPVTLADASAALVELGERAKARSAAVVTSTAAQVAGAAAVKNNI